MREEAETWHGGLDLPAVHVGAVDKNSGLTADDRQRRLSDISLKAPASVWLPTLPPADLEFLAYVHTSLIPFHLLLGPSLRVATTNEQTLSWFTRVLLDESPLRPDDHEDDDDNEQPWHDSAPSQSRIGVLARPATVAPPSSDAGPRVTEVLFFAERGVTEQAASPPTPPGSSQDLHPSRPEVSVRALLLSSDLQPPRLDSSTSDLNGQSRFLPRQSTRPPATAQPGDAKKRLGDMFDEAVSRRKRARLSRAQSISIAASRGVDGLGSPHLGPFDRQAIKDEDGEAEPRVLQPRRVGKEPAPAGQRPVDGGGQKSSGGGSLHAQKATAGVDDESTESRNKEAVSRTVMAGMRIYGLQPARSSNRTKDKSGESGAAMAADAEREAEYKGVYHQAYRATLFTFRRDMDAALLKPEAVRDVVDKLLAIFCHQPP